MTSVICTAHRELFASDSNAAQQAFAQLDRLLNRVRRQQLDAPILAIHHARIEIAQILLLHAQPDGLPMLRQILRDLAQQQPAIPLHALLYFLDMARDALSDCLFFSPNFRDDVEHLLTSLALLQELPDELLCRALASISEPQTLIC